MINGFDFIILLLVLFYTYLIFKSVTTPSRNQINFQRGLIFKGYPNNDGEITFSMKNIFQIFSEVPPYVGMVFHKEFILKDKVKIIEGLENEVSFSSGKITDVHYDIDAKIYTCICEPIELPYESIEVCSDLVKDFIRYNWRCDSMDLYLLDIKKNYEISDFLYPRINYV